MHLDERSDEFWEPTNPGGFATSSPFPTRVPMTTSPAVLPAAQGVVQAGDGVVKAGAAGAYAPKWLNLLPIGQGAAGNQFGMSVLAWTRTPGKLFGAQLGFQGLWIPQPLGTFTVTLGAVTGVQNADLGPGVLFASSITATLAPLPPTGSTVQDWFTISPGTGCATLFLRTLGARYLEVIFSLTTAAGANCMYRKV